MKKIILSIIALLSVTIMEAQKNQTHLTLNNGVVIPQFGLGVYSIACRMALSQRHVYPQGHAEVY